MTEAELVIFEANINATCMAHKQNNWRDNKYRACVTFESEKSKYFIKFDNPKALRPEFLTQSYIYDYSTRHGSGPRVFQPLHFFCNQITAFLIMEYIELVDPSLVTDLAERTAEALNWLSHIPAAPEDDNSPSKDAIGPVGGGLIRHKFFKDHKAPLPFQSVAELQLYMNKVR